MSTLVIKNLPEPLHEKLRRQAQRNHRSMTKEAVTLIEAGVAAQRPTSDSPPTARRRGAIGIEEILAAIEDRRYSHYRSQDEVNAWVDELRHDRDVAP